jgi:hypothetical protein
LVFLVLLERQLGDSQQEEKRPRSVKQISPSRRSLFQYSSIESCEIRNVASCPDEVHGVISVMVTVSVGFFERPAIARQDLQVWT